MLPTEWEAAPGPGPRAEESLHPHRLPRAQVSAPKPARCRLPGNCSGKRGRWKTRWSAHPCSQRRSSWSDVADFAGKDSKHRRRAERSGDCPVLSTPRETHGRERGTLCPLKSLTGKRNERKRFQAIKTQDYNKTVKYNRSHHQVVSENRHTKAKQGNALFIFCLFFTFTPRPRVQEEHTQMCDVLFFPNKSSAPRINSP